MLGAVFTCFIDMLEETHSEEVAEAVFDDVELTDNGAYTAVGYYPDEELVSILIALSKHTGKPVEEILQDFGRYLFHRLNAMHEGMLRKVTNLFDLLAHLDDEIHPQVRRIYPDAVVPHFSVIDLKPNSIVLDYQSPRKLHWLAYGLIEGAAEHFNISININFVEQDSAVRFTVASL